MDSVEHCGTRGSDGDNEGKRSALGTQQNIRLFLGGGGLPGVAAKVSMSSG